MRRTKIGGLLAIAAGVPLIGLPTALAMTPAFLASASARDIAIAAGLVYVGANLFAGGLILLLTGLQQLSLRQPQVRAGALTKLAGANVLIPAIAFATLSDETGPFASALANPVMAAAALVAFFAASRLGIVALRHGWKHDSQSADEVLRADQRAPVLYLRSFRDDAELIVTSSGSRAMRILSSAAFTTTLGPEQELAMIMNRVGPVVAIGKPGERLPELGAARLYASDDEWQQKVEELMQRAALVVIRAGTTDSLWWEIEQALTRVPAHKVILVSLGTPKRTGAFDARFERRFGTPRQSVDAANVPWRWLTWLLRLGLPKGVSMGRVISFDPAGVPNAVPIRFRFNLAWLLMGPYRPYRESLVHAMAQVFHALGLPWAPPGRTQIAAVMLALIGGVFGAHLFYLGRTRRGLWYLLAAPTGVPGILGWIDMVKMALVDRATFARRFGAHRA